MNTKGLKILMISPQPFFTPRGTPFSVYYRAKVLAELGNKIDLVTYPLGKDVRIPGVTLHRTAQVPCIRHVKVGPSVKKLVLDIFLFWKALGMLMRSRYDLVHAHEEAIFFCGVYKFLFKGIKILYDMHSSLPEQLKNFRYSRNPVLVGLFRVLEHWALSYSDSVITICPKLEAYVRQTRPDIPSILIENSLFDPIDFKDHTDELDEDLIRWDRFEGKKIILYTGTFEIYQGIPLLLKSAQAVLKDYPDVLFVLAGGTLEQTQSMRRFSKELGIRKNTLFTGTLNPNTIKRFIKHANILVSPRIRGGNSPLKIYEYLASGKPIVATRHETHTQILASDEAVLTDPNPESFAKGIGSILADSEKERLIGARAKKHYDAEYGAKAYSAKVLEVMGHVA